MRIVVCGIKSENFSSDEKGDWMPKPKSEGPWNCKKCGIEIGGHNQYLHDGMCDDCFFMKYFPEDEKARRKRLVTLENGSQIDPICMETKDIENALGLKEYIETIEGADDKAYAEAFLEFLEKTAVKNMAALGIYEGEVTKQFEIPFDEMKENIRLIAEDRGIFYDEEIEVSQAFTDYKTFFAIVQRGAVFFSGTPEATAIFDATLKAHGINAFHENIESFK